MMEKVTVVLPAYNEERRLGDTVAILESALGRLFPDFEIIISEDGSSDKTAEVGRKLCSERVRLLHSEKRQGKGGAIMNAARSCSGGIIVFMDVDLASNLEHLKELVDSVENGSDIAIGSRYLPGSKTKRSPIRDFFSRSFNLLVRVSLGSRLTDHQCGFKSFRKSTILGVMEEVENVDWFWDTELLVRAQRRGLKVTEIPIEWDEAPGSRFRLIEDTAHMAWSLARFKIKYG
jgi:glycosyltransferase involved in cell wall biosynthesis